MTLPTAKGITAYMIRQTDIQHGTATTPLANKEGTEQTGTADSSYNPDRGTENEAMTDTRGEAPPSRTRGGGRQGNASVERAIPEAATRYHGRSLPPTDGRHTSRPHRGGRE
eukprot:gene13600-28881_t